MSIFGSMIKQIHDAAAGRIQWDRNMWAVIGSRWDKRRIQNRNMIGHPSVNSKGEFISGTHVLVQLQNTKCPCPPAGDLYKSEDADIWWTPRSLCVRCQYHRKGKTGIGRGGFRFPRCVYQRPEDAAGVARRAASTFTGLLKQAGEKTNQILKGQRA